MDDPLDCLHRLAGRAGRQCGGRDALALGERVQRQCEADHRHLARRHRQRLHAETDEHERQQRVTAGLAADTHRLADLGRTVAGRLDDIEHGGLPRVEQVREFALHTVGGHRVLRQVVGPERAEVAVPQHMLGAQRCPGHLDHDAGLGQAILPHAPGEPVRLLRRRDHRRHDADVRAGRLHRVRQGLELGIEQVRAFGRQAQAAPTEGRVLLRPEVGEGERLVGAGVERAHDDPPPGEGCEHLGVDVGLLLDGRGLVAGEEDELGPEESHALEVLGPGLLGVLDPTDVGEQGDVEAIRGAPLPRRRRQCRGATLPTLAQTVDELTRRGERDLTGVTVDSDPCADRDLGRRRALHDGRDAHLGGQDRGVGRATAGLGDDADDQRPVEGGRLGGREVLGDDDAGLGEGRDAGCGLPQHGGDRP